MPCAVHVLGLGIAVPADLLDAVEQFVDMAGGIERIEMPVRARQVTAGAMNAFATLTEPVKAVGHLLQAADLPGDLVDAAGHREFGRELVQRAIDLARKEHEGVMLGAMPAEVAHAGPELGHFLGWQTRPEVQRIGDAKAQQIAVEMLAHFRVEHIDAEVTQATYLERAWQAHATDQKLFLRAGQYSGVHQ